MVVSSFANADTGYNSQKDFAPVGLVATTSLLVAVNAKSSINTFQEFLTAAKAQPGKLTFGSGGVGNPGHLAFEQLRSITKIDVLHVPFKGGAQATTALMSEEIDMVIDGSTFAQVKSGRLKALAVTGPRLPALPDVPSIGETVKGFNFTNWWGIITPAGTPTEALNRLNKELNAIAALPEIRERLKDLGLEAKSSTPRQFADHVRSETENVGLIVKDAGIKFQ
jgi:tripartite-type tricarboxylate transporter receptor subunit TctC